MRPPQQFPFARESAGPAPLRRPGSIRRTTSIDSDWPNGHEHAWDLVGRARDLLTPFEPAEPVVLATGGFHILSSPLREILTIDVEPTHARIQELVGVRAGRASRLAIARILKDLTGTPAFQLLDDFAGASLVAAWIWSRWINPPHHPGSTAGKNGSLIDVCTGFTEGGTAYLPDGTADYLNQSFAVVEPLENPDDPEGWHAMPVQQGPQNRRARRLDLWREGGLIKVDAGFQDSGSNPDGGRTAIHEYRVYAEIDEASDTLVALQALPLILPYHECPGAAVKVSRMIGHKVMDFRNDVLETLPGTLGCTHLNDVLRSFADVPELAKSLPNCTA